jgi:outer membrane lipoprotein SlyB
MRSFAAAPILALAVASCAPAAPGPVSVAPEAASGAGTLMAVRPIAPQNDSGNDSAAWRAVLLAGVPDPAAATAPAAAPLAEFIVREDAGATLSIVQPNAADLRVGDRVFVAHPAALAGRASLIRAL